ncbi:MAG: EamA family transporter [Clostridia bacterium]|nr:EamA family transporter [Clostridia bacterium]
MSYFVQFLLLAGISVLGCVKVSLQGSMSRRYVRCTQDGVWFNGMLFAAIACCMCLIFPLAKPDLSTVLHAAAAGVCVVLFQTCYALALASGPVSLTTLIVNFSVLLVAGFGMAMYGDRLYATQIAGIAALVVSMFLSVEKKENEKKRQGRWLLLVLLAMTGDSGIGFVQRMFSVTPGAATPHMDITFSAIMYVIASLLAFAFYFCNTRCGLRSKSSMGFDWHVLLYVAAIAAVLSVYQKGMMLSVANIEGTFLHPTHSGLMSLIMTAIGLLFFHDRLSSRQRWGVAFGILCVVLMNVRLGPAV